jgi:hypothetical protein
VDDFVLSNELGEMIMNFLVKMAFLIGEGSEKDPELAALHGHTLGLLDLALQLFNSRPLKLGTTLDRLLQVCGLGERGGGNEHSGFT